MRTYGHRERREAAMENMVQVHPITRNKKHRIPQQDDKTEEEEEEERRRQSSPCIAKISKAIR